MKPKRAPKVIRIEGKRYYLFKDHGEFLEYIGEGGGRLFLSRTQAEAYELIERRGGGRVGRS